MNNKIIDYEEAVKQLNLLSAVQGFMKQLKCITVEDQRVTRENIRVRRKEINLLLSIIASEKKARKLWAEAKYYREMMSGVSSTKRGAR
jgi:hypothetical protein